MVNVEVKDVRDLLAMRLKEFADDLKSRNFIDAYTFEKKDFVKLTLEKKVGMSFAIYVFPTTEAFSRKFNDSYETFETAYEDDDKKEVINGLMKEAKQFLIEPMTEQIYEKNGQIAYRVLKFADGSNETSSPIFLGKFRRHFGYKQRTVEYNK